MDNATNIKCDQNGCTKDATHSLVWTKYQCYCDEHIQRVLSVAEAMGFPTPAATLRRIIPLLDSEEATDVSK